MKRSMKPFTCMVVGGGHAGLHAAKAIRQLFRDKLDPDSLRLVLLDKQPGHLRKVLLFRPAVGDESITVPWEQVVDRSTECLLGEAQAIDGEGKRLLITDANGQRQQLDYDALVIAVGSVARRADPDRGGITLGGLEDARRIRERWQSNLRLAASTKEEAVRRRLLTAAVVGGGITGIETAAELAQAMRAEAVSLGLKPEDVCVSLLNAQPRLFAEAPDKVARRLERCLGDVGVAVRHGERALRERDGRLLLENGQWLDAGVVVWTLGFVAPPALRGMGLPLSADGQVVVDASYRVEGMPGVYSIGDCARIVDPASGLTDGMTCKEAVPQASRLAAVIAADLKGEPAPVHRRMFDTFTIGLGPRHGLLWVRRFGIDMIVTGKLAASLKSYLWKVASLLA